MDSIKKDYSMLSIYRLLIVVILVFSGPVTFAWSDKKATIKLSFEQTDSTKTCKALVKSDTGVVKGVEVHFYVERSFHNLPINKAVETDEKGEATMDFPVDLPGDKNGNIIVIAKIEDDDNYGTVETQSAVRWGAVKAME